MSWGGAVQSMLTALKNNKNLTGKRAYYFDTKGSTKYLKKRTNFKKASPQLIKKIRTRLQKENRKERIIQIIILLFFTTIAIYLIWF